MKTAEELWDLLREAYGLPYGGAQIALVDQILPHVDGAGDPELAYTARTVATTAYVYGGEPARAFVTFAWCLADFDTNPSPYHARMRHSLLWDFKTMVSALLRFPEVPLDRTNAVLDDMERRYREGGHSMQAVHKRRYLVARHLGDATTADAWYERWVTAPRDDLSDCVGCDPSDKVSYLSLRHRDEEAVVIAGPVLAGDLKCTEQPQTILNALMVPYLRTGRPAEAADAHRRAYQLQRHKLADLSDIGEHIAFCARTGNEHRGLEMLQRHVDWLDRAPSPSAEMWFAASASLLLRRLAEIGHDDAVVRVPVRGEVPAGVLGPELAERATRLAGLFDERNGTPEQGRQIAERLAAEPFDVGLALSPTVRAQPARRTAPPPEPGPVEIPADAGAATLLDLADDHERADLDKALEATLAAFDARFPDPETLDPRTAARRYELRATELWESSPDAGISSAERAIELFTAAGAGGDASAVRGRLGVANCLAGRGAEGLPLIEDDVAYQEEHGDLRDRAYAWSRLSTAHFLARRPEDADAAQNQADALVAELGDDRLAARYALRRARNRAALGRLDEAAAAAAASRAYFRDNGPAVRYGEASAVYGQLIEDPAEQVTVFGEVLDTRAPGPELTVLLHRGRALMRLDRAAEAVSDLVEAVALSTERGWADAGAYARQDLATAYRMAGHPAEAAEVAEEALTGFEQLGLDEPGNDTRLLLAGLYRELGDNLGSLDRYTDLLNRLADNPAGHGQVAEMYGQLLFDLDRDAEAADTFGGAAEDLRRAGDPVGELRLLRRRLLALHYADDVEAAEETIHTATGRYAALPPEVANDPPAIWGRAMFAFETGRLLMTRGRFAEALPHLEGAPERLRAIGAGDDADRVDGMYAEALLRSGAPVEAEARLRALLAGMATDAPTRGGAAGVLADLLDRQGRAEEAGELRKAEGLT